MRTAACVLLVAGLCAGSRLLVLFSVPGRSHGLLGESLVKILLEAGHEVTYVAPFPQETNSRNLRHININPENVPKHNLHLEDLVQNPMPSHHVLQVGGMFAARALKHPAVQELITDSDVTFDAVIAEWFYTGLIAPIAEVFNCPLIWYISNDMSWHSLRIIHEGSSPTYSFDPHVQTAPSTPFSLADRIYQTGLQIYLRAWIFYTTSFLEVAAYKDIYETAVKARGRILPDYESLVYNASLMLVNSHPPLGQRLAMPLNAKYVGGHHIDLTTDPIPKDLKNLLDDAKNGVIFFSLGSNLKAKDLSDSIKEELLDLFGELEQTVIWKFEGELDNIPANVHLLEWAPQKSILSHPNTFLFITHGGILSLMEATHYGVPVIGIPIYGDQFVNVDLTVARGGGIRVDFSDQLPRKIKDAIHQILANYSYRTKAKFASSIFRRRLASPQKELLHWLQLVLDTQGAAHLRSPAVQVSTLDRYHLDMLVVTLMVLWFLSKVVKVIQVHLNSNSEDLEKKEA